MNREAKIDNEAVYNCSFCGNEIVVPIDESAGMKQELLSLLD